MNLYQKVKTVLTEPSKFFEHLKEKGVGEAFVYLLILGLFTTILGALIAKATAGPITRLVSAMFKAPIEQEQLGLPLFIGLMFAGYIFMLIFSFAGAGILHLYLKIFGGKANYTQTYQLVIYGMTPRLVFGWIPIIGGFAGIYDFVLMIIGTHKIHKITMNKTILIYVIPVAIILMLLLLIAAGAIILAITKGMT